MTPALEQAQASMVAALNACFEAGLPGDELARRKLAYDQAHAHYMDTARTEAMLSFMRKIAGYRTDD